MIVRSRIDDLKDELEAAGYRPGTGPFEAELRKRRVELCMYDKNVASCSECPAFDSCELIKSHLRDLRFGVDPAPETKPQ